MFKNIYQKIAALTRHKYAVWMLVGLSFLESCVSPLTPMVLLIPMCLASPKKSWRYAIIATVAALFGSILGYLIGHFLISFLMPFIESHGYLNSYNTAVDWFHTWGLWVMFPASLIIFPPYKFFTIAAGVVSVKFVPFLFVVLAARFAHFALVPLLMMFHKASWLQSWEEKHLE